jgi:hypothetical protein
VKFPDKECEENVSVLCFGAVKFPDKECEENVSVLYFWGTAIS